MLVQGTINVGPMLEQGLKISTNGRYVNSTLVQGTIDIGPILDQGLNIGLMLESSFEYWSNICPSSRECWSNIGRKFKCFSEPCTNIW